MSNKLEITVDELHTYLHCPAKYRFEFIHGIQGEKSKSEKFKEALHKTIYYFFYSVMNEKLPTLANLKDKWAATCEAYFGDEIKKESILSIRPGFNKDGRRDILHYPEFIKGMEMLNHFYQFNKDNPGTPIAVDYDYRVAMGDVIIKGKFELIREIVDKEDGKRYIEIVDFKTNDRPLEYVLVKNDMNLMLASYAFRNLFKTEEDRTKYHYMSSGRDIVVRFKGNDYGRIQSIVHGVTHGIREKHFYPRQTFMCKNCGHKDICAVAQF